MLIQEQVKIDDISCGHALTVSEHATHIVMEDELAAAEALAIASPFAVSSDHFLPLSRFVGRTGIVTAVNVNQRCVQLLLFDSDTSAKHCRWFPVSTLCKPQRLWVDPCQELVSQSWKHVAHAYIANEQALSVRKVRTSILKLFGSWPSNIPFTLQQLGGPSAVVDMLKLSASELLSTHLTRRESATSGSSSHQLLQTFQSKLSLLIDREVELFAAEPSSLPAVRIDESMYEKDRLDRALSSSSADSQYLLPRLVEETIVHFIQAVNHPTPMLTVKSPHPYPSHSDVRERLYIPGASKLLITFDPACAISEDMLTRLTFYRDSQYQDAVMVCSGDTAAATVAGSRSSSQATVCTTSSRPAATQSTGDTSSRCSRWSCASMTRRRCKASTWSWAAGCSSSSSPLHRHSWCVIMRWTCTTPSSGTSFMPSRVRRAAVWNC